MNQTTAKINTGASVDSNCVADELLSDEFWEEPMLLSPFWFCTTWSTKSFADL